jgi:MFS transporter, putative metabolite:H+ symporter
VTQKDGREAAGVFALNDRKHPAFFWLGALVVTVGVGLHLPMYIRSAAMNFHVAGMPIDGTMLIGMALIIGGTAAAYYGLLPSAVKIESPGIIAAELSELAKDVSPEPEGKLRPAHWQLLFILTLAVVIDSMKPASLGFVVPGTAQEYGLSREVVALFPFTALTGLTIGSYVWGVIADRVGRRAAILLSGIMFVGTAICGSMPAFEWNLLMCFFMGLAAGGMLPITYALLAECMPTKHRGWTLVLVGAFGLIGGWFAASGCAALFEPHFGWRIMWFLNAPTGIILILCNNFIPESPRFLLARGRLAEAHGLVQRYRLQLDPRQWTDLTDPEQIQSHSAATLVSGRFRATTATLNVAAAAWGLVNFGLLLWLPADLRDRGYSISGSNELLFYSSLLALPTTAVVAWFYSSWSTKWTLFVLTILTGFALLGLALLDSPIAFFRDNPLVLFSLLMVGVNGIIAVLLPYSAENYPVLVRGRATGLVAGSSKFGGLAANALTVAALVPGLIAAAVMLAFPIALSAGMVARYGRETRHRELE